MKKVLKVIGIILASVLALVIIFWGGLNIAKFGIYSEYYGLNSNVCKNPGLSDGFVCQGIGYSEEQEVFLVSGYMKDHSVSRIYITNNESDSRFVEINVDGKAFAGHSGGISCHGDDVFVASEDAVHLFKLSDILGAAEGSAVNATETVPVNNQASFSFADEHYLYVGEFHDGENYVTEHPYETPNGTNYAIVSRYSYDDLTKPERIYSLPNKVQGFAVTPGGKIVLSTSYGLNDSYFYVYNLGETTDSGLTLDGAPVYFLGECVNEIKAPAMSEGLALYDGNVITLFESACDKYIFGKFFFANHIVKLDF